MFAYFNFGLSFLMIPISVVVPPMSITTASLQPVKNDAPTIELVTPDAKVLMGHLEQISASTIVPLFWVKKILIFYGNIFLRFFMVYVASGLKVAFKIVAFYL
jgi:hypothetical protein